MITSPEPVTVYPDATVTFSCLAWSYGELAYQWNRKDNSTISSSSCNTAINEISISNVQVMDEGPYCCVVSNECGNITECAWLEVDSKYSVLIILKDR